MGNLRSVVNAVRAIGHTPILADRPEQLAGADRIILPGVGAFGEAMSRLEQLQFIPALEQAVLVEKRPFLGICLGMQLLATRGFEHGENRGLGWIPGEVKAIEAGELRVPHIGWNAIAARSSSPLLADLPERPAFYFVHSFQFVASDKQHEIAHTDYGGDVTAIISRDHIFGTQFHPEKSHKIGLGLLRNFLQVAAPC
ncbi:MAG: imidazole glycerol phosphate synthase subunit HisH [Kofleriaceae bacterium]